MAIQLKKIQLKTLALALRRLAADSDDEAMPFAMKMRSRLPCLEAGEEVLARWTDDGWYYRGSSPTAI